MLINSSSMSMMSMMGGGESKDAKPKLDPATIFSKEKLAAEAANLGEGVTFVSSEPVTQGEMKGVKAIYAFTDFNKLKVSTALPGHGGRGHEACRARARRCRSASLAAAARRC